MAQSGNSGGSNPFSMLQNIFQRQGEDEIYNLVKELQDCVKESGWPQEITDKGPSNDKSKEKENGEQDLGFENTESLEEVTSKGKSDAQDMDLISTQNQNFKGSRLLDQQNKDVKGGASMMLPDQQETATDRSKEDFEVLTATGDDEILNRVQDLKYSLKNLISAQEKGDELSVNPNNKEKDHMELDLGLGNIESVEVVTSKGKRDAQVMGLLSELKQNIKSSDWLDQQEKPAETAANNTLPEQQGATNDMPGDDFEIMPAAVDDSDPLVGMIQNLHQSIMDCDNWVEESTEKMKMENPDLIASIMEARSKDNSVCKK